MKIPHTGMIATTDLIITPDDLHPGFKWEIGRRLAQWPLAKEYDVNVTPSGPIYKSMRRKKDMIKLRFSYAGKGLCSKDGKPLNQFEIAGADGKFVPAEAEIKGNKIMVFSSSVSKPIHVRFGWNEGGKANFYNQDGLPALPFRTNNPLTDQFKKEKRN